MKTIIVLLTGCMVVNAMCETKVESHIPETPQEPVTDEYHGVLIEDPYRWLEGSDAPEVTEEGKELDRRVSEWTDEQNAYTRYVLDHLPGRKELEDRIRPLMEIGSVSAPEARLNRYFYWKREGKQAQPVLYKLQGLDGDAEVLLDPNQLDEEGLLAPSFSEPSPDGERLAFGLYEAGDENTTLYLMRVSDGTWLADEIPGKVTGVQWTPDGEGFFYHRLRDLKDPYSRQIKFHRIGAHEREDDLLFEQYREGPLATTWGPYANVSRDARWLVLGYWTGTDANDLWVVDLERWFREGKFVKQEIVTGEKATHEGRVRGDTLFLHTTLGASNGRVVAVNLHQPAVNHWREIVPERTNAVLENIGLSKSYLVAEYLQDARSKIEVFDLAGNKVRELELPSAGSANIRVEEDRDEAFLTFESFHVPESIYRVDLQSGQRELWERPEVPVDPEIVEVKQVFYNSKDGTRVPMFLVYKQGLEKNGNNPVMLTGYGGFNISRTPAFSATLYPWLEDGGIYALANLRGGGEYGEEWHRAGMLDRKQNVFDDFIAAAEWLVKEGYTRPEKLAIVGGSNGGLLTGAVVLQRPDLFGAVISAVPLLDMLRFQHFLMARYWVPEYGDSAESEQFEFLKEYSPYQKVEKGVEYPAVFFTAGENDSRVHPMHARKMAAKMQRATGSDQKKKPILLWVDRSAGHGAGKPLELRIREVVDQRVFLRWQLGMLED